MLRPTCSDFLVYAKRRDALLQQVRQQYPDKQGLLVLYATFEQPNMRFKQESNFYYLTGITEPGTIVTIDTRTGHCILYMPQYATNRAAWESGNTYLESGDAKACGFHEITPLGEACPGYTITPNTLANHYSFFVQALQKGLNNGESIITVPTKDMAIAFLRSNVEHAIEGLAQATLYTTAVIAMRQKKEEHEMDLLCKAVEITMQAQEAAARVIKADAPEAEIQASLEYIFTASGAHVAFPSIVAGGVNATRLHYTQNNTPLNGGELVVVDIGASYGHYCADLTRTYPVSGKFTKRQKELYTIVLETQEYIAELAKPGMWLNNKEQASKSLHHIAKAFLEGRGYGEYFTHGIGHHLGLDVHDVGDYSKPLQEGDVITIEPGIYIPKEKIGIRIEDNYWIVKNGAICLSELLPKQVEDIEELMREKLAE